MTVRPVRVLVALMALWAAWLVTAAAVFINQFYFHGSGVGPGPAIAVGSLAVQACAFLLVSRGDRIARFVVVLFLVLAAPPLQIVGRLLAEGASFSAAYLVLAFTLKGIGVFLLFTGSANEWFAAER
jgi:hypothetical protein